MKIAVIVLGLVFLSLRVGHVSAIPVEADGAAPGNDTEALQERQKAWVGLSSSVRQRITDTAVSNTLPVFVLRLTGDPFFVSVHRKVPPVM